MGFMNKLTGAADKGLLKNGILGRGLVVQMGIGGSTVQSGGGMVERVCDFVLEVSIDNVPTYQATCRQRIPEVNIPQIQQGGVTLAVRVDPDDHSKVTLDLYTDPPVVTSAPQPGAPRAADILATGQPAKAVIVESAALGKKNAEGVDLYGFVLSVLPEAQAPYQVKVGNPTPPNAVPLLFPGSHVPVKIGADPNFVVIDWQEALASPDI